MGHVHWDNGKNYARLDHFPSRNNQTRFWNVQMTDNTKIHDVFPTFCLTSDVEVKSQNNATMLYLCSEVARTLLSILFLLPHRVTPVEVQFECDVMTAGGAGAATSQRRQNQPN